MSSNIFFILEIGIVSVALIVTVVSGIVLLSSSPQDTIVFIVGNETYHAVSGLDFGSITIDNDYIVFNSTGFIISAENDISMEIRFLTVDMSNAGNDERVLEFAADSSGGMVWFNLSGFIPGRIYDILLDDLSIGNETANVSGYISFSDVPSMNSLLT